MNIIKETLKTIIIVAILVAGVSIVSAWTGPTEAPTGGNTPTPINISATEQIKSGPLQVNGFRNLGSSIFDGNVGIGTADPGTNKLQVNGKIQAIGGDICTDAGGGKCLSSVGVTAVASGLYGICQSDGTAAIAGSVKAPASISGGKCVCPATYTRIRIGNYATAGSTCISSDIEKCSTYNCYKN